MFFVLYGWVSMCSCQIIVYNRTYSGRPNTAMDILILKLIKINIRWTNYICVPSDPVLSYFYFHYYFNTFICNAKLILFLGLMIAIQSKPVAHRSPFLFIINLCVVPTRFNVFLFVSFTYIKSTEKKFKHIPKKNTNY